MVGAHEKWVRAQGFVVRPRKSIVSHHNVVRFYWEMVPAGGGEVAAAGLNILILGPDGRIRSDYQFSEPPASPPRELSDVVERYLEFWNEGGTRTKRRGRLAELWAEDATFLSATVERHGYAGIEAEALDTYAAGDARGFVFRAANATEGHHDAVRMSREMRPKDGGRWPRRAWLFCSWMEKVAYEATTSSTPPDPRGRVGPGARLQRGSAPGCSAPPVYDTYALKRTFTSKYEVRNFLRM